LHDEPEAREVADAEEGLGRVGRLALNGCTLEHGPGHGREQGEAGESASSSASASSPHTQGFDGRLGCPQVRRCRGGLGFGPLQLALRDDPIRGKPTLPFDSLAGKLRPSGGGGPLRPRLSKLHALQLGQGLAPPHSLPRARDQAYDPGGDG